MYGQKGIKGMLYIILLAALVSFYAFMSFAGAGQTKRLLRTGIDERARIQTYAATTFGQWIPVIAVFSVVAFSDISLADIGFTLPAFTLNPVITVVVFAAAVLWSSYFLYMIIAFLVSARHRQRRNELLARKAGGDDYYDLVIARLMTPKTPREKAWWLPLSLSAGICEEIIFRGALVFLVTSVFPGIPLYLTFAIVLALFGLAHFYQGGKGLLYTALVGAFFTLIYIATGTLIFVIAIHFLQDFANAFEYSE
jgi:membrane protease YdiL (CAAX protease family)